MVSNGVDAQILQHLEGLNDEPDSPEPEVVGGKKKRGQRAPGVEKGGKGLRHFSLKVCEKVESKGRTTHNEVADELVAEFINPESPHPDQVCLGNRAGQQQYEEKNIRRRVYDALNVLMAMGIILKDKKDIQWKGLPCTSLDDVKDLKAKGMRARQRIERKAAYLHELQAQTRGLRNLVARNERLYHGTDSIPAGGVALPFILVQTRPQATVEVEFADDMQVVHFDFNSTPFELHDDAYVLKAMSLQEQQGGDSVEILGDTDFDDNGVGGNMEDERPSLISGLFQHAPHSSSPYYGFAPGAGKSGQWPPVPGILKARVKHENLS